MNTVEAAKLALESIWANRLRSFLTLLGVILGIAAIVATAAVIQGLNRYVAEKLSNLGKGVFTVQRVGLITNREQFLEAIRRNKKLLPADGRAIAERCPLAETVAWETHAQVDLRRGTLEIRDTDIGGVTGGILEIEPYEVEQGRLLTHGDDDRAAAVAFLGADVVERLFPNTDPVGKTLRIAGHDLEVVGTAQKKGSFLGFSQDNYVKIPFRLHRQLFGSQRSVNISVKAVDDASMAEAMDEVSAVLRARHHLRPADPDDFTLVTAEGINDLWRKLTQTIFAVALFVVGISLVVGGIVIMNIMLVSVVERTREIGVRKALGATRGTILWQFLVEASTLTTLGALIGLVLGGLLAWVIRSNSTIPASIPTGAIISSLLAAAFTGIVFGMLPATRASRLDPVEALRHE